MSLRMPSPDEVAVTARVLPGAALTGPDADSEAGVPVMVEVVPPAGESRTPCDICCVVDVSGSMSVEAMLKTEAGDMNGHGLSVLDIVKHALKTIIQNLNHEDRLALVAYSNDARTIFGLTEMTENGRNETERKLSDLTPAGMTNLWDGLKTGFELLKDGAQPGRLQHIMLFTDGLPNINPPRGILPMLKRLKDKEGGKLPCTVSTFGFGYELDSELLSQLAIDGAGSYAHIPDAGFVGTVFVNATANLLVTMAKDTVLTLEPMNGASFVENSPVLGGYSVVKKDASSLSLGLGMLQFGQSKNIVVQMKMPAGAVSGSGYLRATVDYSTRTSEPSRCECVGKDDANAESIGKVEPHRLRLRFVDSLRTAMQKAKLTTADKASGKPIPLDGAQAVVQAMVAEIGASPAKGSENMEALLEDLTGQVTEATSREEWYTRWGIHYLPSLMFAHLNQQCNNFKDAGVQHYGGDLFVNVRDAADDVFLSLPAPTPSCSRPAAAPAAPAAAAAPVAVAPVVAAPISMAAFHDRYSGCFDGACRVLLADGSLRRADQVCKGDMLAAAPGVAQASPSEVLCSVRTVVREGRLPLVELEGGLRITAYHPVFVGGVWRFPSELSAAEDRPCEAVFSFLLREGSSSAFVERVPCATLGHGLQEGAARHPFFGSWPAVRADLLRLPGFESGLVDLAPGSARRDPETGLVCSLAAADGAN